MTRRRAGRRARLLAGLMLAAAGACDRPPTEPGSVPWAVLPVSGDNQIGHTGSWLPLPLKVRVMDARADPVTNVRVDWNIVGASGELATWTNTPPVPFTFTDQSGTAQVFVRFAGLTAGGIGTVTASVREVAAAPVRFTAKLSLLIRFGPEDHCAPGDPSLFYTGIKADTTATVPAGVAVEWKYAQGLSAECRARLVATAVPPGAERFDSGELAPGGTFRFVPKVAGTYHYAETINGGRATLTVLPDPNAPVPPPAPTTGPEHIYLANVADGVVTARLALGGAPAWSPDGRRIAYHREDGIHVMNADGSNDVALKIGVFPSWSPDARRIAFAHGEGIAVMNADGSGVTTIVRNDFHEQSYKPWDMGVGQPVWSPRGNRIAFMHNGDGDMLPGQAYVVNVDGSDRRRATWEPGGVQYAESNPSWSPNGASILLWSYGHGIAQVDTGGGPPSALLHDFPAVSYGAKPVWSPDGRAIAFTRGRNTPGGAAVWIMSATGANARPLIANGYDAAWSPDGSRIAFVSTRIP